MTIKQIYNTINSIAQNMTIGTTTVTSHADFVSFGGDVLSSATNKETFYSILVDRIGKTIFSIREYKADNRNIRVDAFTFGSILQKISYKLQNSETNYTWETSPQNPYNLTPKGGIIQKLFAQNLPTFAYTDVLLDYQLESAFIDAQHMSGFINGIATRMYNAMEVSIEGMNNEAFNALVTEVYKSATDVDAPVNARRARNLLEEYNDLLPTGTTNLTVSNCLRNADFLKYCCIEMGTVAPFMCKLTSMYNDGTVERFTDKDNLIVELNTEFEKSYSVYLQSDTFHDELVALPNYSSIPYWDNPTNPMSIASNDGTTTTTISNVLAVFRDKDAVVTTLERESYVSKYDEWNKRTYVKLSCDRRYIADTSENVVIFYIA